MKHRLDKEIVARSLVSSRTKTQELINSKLVLCDDMVIFKSSFEVSDNIKIVL